MTQSAPLSPHQLWCLLTVYLSPGCELSRNDLVHNLHGLNHYNGLRARGLLERCGEFWVVTNAGEAAIMRACSVAAKRAP